MQASLLSRMDGVNRLMASLLYGSGLRLMECLRLRVSDVDFYNKLITVRNGKGGKDRVTLLPEPLIPLLQDHLQNVKLIHKTDLENGAGTEWHLLKLLGMAIFSNLFSSNASRFGE
jgi:integrase